MPQIQEIYDKIKQLKEEQKHIREAYKNELSHSEQYQEIKDALEELKVKKKEIENAVKQSMNNDFAKLESLKLDIESDTEMISDLAVNKIMKGETVQIEDEFGNKYDPVISVKFKKQ